MKSIVSLLVIAVGIGTAASQQSAPLNLKQTIALPGVTGKFDHFAVDVEGKRLFAAATGNHTVEVIDLVTGKDVQSITGLGKPHGLVWVRSNNTLYVADGALAELRQYRGAPLALAGSIKLSDDADDMVYNEAKHLLFVGHGGSAAAPARIAVVDTNGFHLERNLAVASHPEALEIDPQGQRIFANIAEDGEIAIVDGAGDAVTNKWKLAGAKSNVPSAFDAEDHVLFVACRAPAVLLALDAATGKELARISSADGADDLFFDASSHRVYLIAGAGEVDVFEVSSGMALKSLGATHTEAGAKTALFVPSQSLLYVGVPGVAGKPAEIRIYAPTSGRGGN